VQRNPQPDKNEIIKRYNSTFGNDYLSYEIENEAAFLKLQQLALKDVKFARLEKKLFKQINADANTNLNAPCILDIGCATGSLLEDLNKRGWSVTGVEISPCAEYAREKRKLNVKSDTLEECNFSDSSFDVVHASHLIEHLNDPKIFLQEVYRVLKEKGHLFITTPNINGFQARLFRGQWRSAIFDHLYLFSDRTLIKLLKTAGFKIVKCRTWGGLAAGSAPKWIKKPADFLVKQFGCGDVMIVHAKK